MCGIVGSVVGCRLIRDVRITAVEQRTEEDKDPLAKHRNNGALCAGRT